jgi:ABC-type enterobactin transport system permease subunit
MRLLIAGTQAQAAAAMAQELIDRAHLTARIQLGVAATGAVNPDDWDKVLTVDAESQLNEFEAAIRQLLP